MRNEIIVCIIKKERALSTSGFKCENSGNKIVIGMITCGYILVSISTVVSHDLLWSVRNPHGSKNPHLMGQIFLVFYAEKSDCFSFKIEINKVPQGKKRI